MKERREAGPGDHDLNHYFKGMYLLDPFYNRFEIQERTGVFDIKSDTLDDLGASDTHLNYWQYLRVRLKTH